MTITYHCNCIVNFQPSSPIFILANKIKSCQTDLCGYNNTDSIFCNIKTIDGPPSPELGKYVQNAYIRFQFQNSLKKLLK